MNYLADHASEVWVKYTSSDTEEWSKFQILKKGATASLPSPQLRKYCTPVPLKATKATDVWKIIEKYVPAEHKGFYDVIRSVDNVSSETDEGDEYRTLVIEQLLSGLNTAEFTCVSSVYPCQCVFLCFWKIHIMDINCSSADLI